MKSDATVYVVDDDEGIRHSLELLLRGTLESFVERSFRTYRHLDALAGAR